MNIREAILKAADSIESRPDLFNYWATVPDQSCGAPGCALGWIALHAGTFHGRTWDREQLAKLLGGDRVNHDYQFYQRMNGICEGWESSARTCAPAMRLYADKYHPAETPKGIPSSVLAIFKEDVCDCAYPDCEFRAAAERAA